MRSAVTTMHADVISPGADLAEGSKLDVMGPADLCADMVLSFCFTQGSSRLGRVIRVEDFGARAVVELDRKRWWLHRRDAVLMGPARYAWTVGELEE
jgi:hypothetical protein